MGPVFIMALLPIMVLVTVLVSRSFSESHNRCEVYSHFDLCIRVNLVTFITGRAILAVMAFVTIVTLMWIALKNSFVWTVLRELLSYKNFMWLYYMEHHIDNHPRIALCKLSFLMDSFKRTAICGLSYRIALSKLDCVIVLWPVQFFMRLICADNIMML